ncbi:gamma-glutamylcyclotransferase family protein [Flagellimonas onchidii]|uniref:gamma-glutamylcyclotransferase family protein n=1 Tax=Flagellimonas onchidii TaxID=2562684 RepID=UPI0010A6620D|nr:gamma-glutamylcyclotransferase family protein [Allomuricauda onchidii]
MRRTQNYFCYCDLQTKERQMQVLGRQLNGKKDKLPGFKTIEKNNVGPYLAKSKKDNSEVSGTLYRISFYDLFNLDEYEKQFETKRIKTTLKSGSLAWVYV